MPYYARTRTRDSRTLCPPYTRKYGTGPKVVYNSETVYTGVLETVKDNEAPNFRARMRSGQIILNEMYSTRDERSNVCDKITFQDPGWSAGDCVWEGNNARRLEGTTVTLATSALSAVGASSQNSLVRAYSKMNRTDIMGGELLKDLGSTLGMLRKPFSTAQDLLGRMVKNRSRHAGKTAQSFAKATANTWLEYRYGWRPLIGDARTVIKLANRNRTEAFVKGRRVVHGTDEVVTTNSPRTCQSWLYDGWLTVNLNGFAYDTHTCRASSGIYFVLSEPSSEAERWSRSLGMTSKDIVPTIWECIPYSFVVDWFVDVGGWLQAVVPNPFVQILGSYTTYEIQSSRKVTGTWSYRTKAGVLKSGTISPETAILVTRTRSVNPSVAKFPAQKGKLLSALQTADGLGLLCQKVLNGLKSFHH